MATITTDLKTEGLTQIGKFYVFPPNLTRDGQVEFMFRHQPSSSGGTSDELHSARAAFFKAFQCELSPRILDKAKLFATMGHEVNFPPGCETINQKVAFIVYGEFPEGQETARVRECEDTGQLHLMLAFIQESWPYLNKPLQERLRKDFRVVEEAGEARVYFA